MTYDEQNPLKVATEAIAAGIIQKVVATSTVHLYKGLVEEGLDADTAERMSVELMNGMLVNASDILVAVGKVMVPVKGLVEAVESLIDTPGFKEMVSQR